MRAFIPTAFAATLALQATTVVTAFNAARTETISAPSANESQYEGSQDDGVPQACWGVWNTYIDTVAICPETTYFTCSCPYISGLTDAYNCLVAQGAASQSGAQGFVDEMTQQCAANNAAVPSQTITATNTLADSSTPSLIIGGATTTFGGGVLPTSFTSASSALQTQAAGTTSQSSNTSGSLATPASQSTSGIASTSPQSSPSASSNSNDALALTHSKIVSGLFTFILFLMTYL